jgi:hypothetical protein
MPPGSRTCPSSWASVVARSVADSLHVLSKLMILLAESAKTPLPALPILKFQPTKELNALSSPAKKGDFAAAVANALYADNSDQTLSPADLGCL